MSETARPSFVIVIPAKNEIELLPATLAGLAGAAFVHAVVVVDDGSADGTAEAAEQSGALVIRRARSAGKAAALMDGVQAARKSYGDDTIGIVLLDADVGESVTELHPLMAAVAQGPAELAIAKYVARGSAGGRGLVVGAARKGIEARTGFSPQVPLSGIRAMTWRAWDAVSPLASGWGVETAMTIDALAAGIGVVEVDTGMTHRATGGDWRGQIHRGRQYLDVRRALLARRSLLKSRR
ncbi:MAG: glycosyltransferase [Sporichthyaceae bacterium]